MLLKISQNSQESACVSLCIKRLHLLIYILYFLSVVKTIKATLFISSKLPKKYKPPSQHSFVQNQQWKHQRTSEFKTNRRHIKVNPVRRCFSVFIVNFKQIFHIVQAFSLLILNNYMKVGLKHYPANIYFFKANNSNTRRMCKIC